MALTYAYYLVVKTSGGDAYGYFMGYRTFSDSSPFTGTHFVTVLTQLIVAATQQFENPFLTTFVPFSLLGFIGSIALFFALKNIAPIKSRVPAFSLFFPGTIFWSSNIGKDSLVFFAIGIFTYMLSELPKKKNFMPLLFPLALVFLVRPHIGLVCAIAFALSIFTSKRLNLRNIAIIVGCGLLIFLAFDTFTAAMGINTEDAFYDQFTEKIEGSSDYFVTKDSGSNAARTDGFNILYTPVYLLSFLASPFIWESRNLLQILASIEGLIYLFMTGAVIFYWDANLPFRNFLWHRFSLIYIVIVSVVLGAALTNFGLIMRQRIMIFPFLMLLYAVEMKSSRRVRKQRRPKNQDALPT